MGAAKKDAAQNGGESRKPDRGCQCARVNANNNGFFPANSAG